MGDVLVSGFRGGCRWETRKLLIPPTFRLPDLVSLPSARRPLTSQSFLTELLPPILCYYATAVLVLLPRTFPIRLALLPISLWAAFRAATTIDLAQGYNEDGLAYLNHGLLVRFSQLLQVCRIFLM